MNTNDDYQIAIDISKPGFLQDLDRRIQMSVEAYDPYWSWLRKQTGLDVSKEVHQDYLIDQKNNAIAIFAGSAHMFLSSRFDNNDKIYLIRYEKVVLCDNARRQNPGWRR